MKNACCLVQPEIHLYQWRLVLKSMIYHLFAIANLRGNIVLMRAQEQVLEKREVMQQATAFHEKISKFDAGVSSSFLWVRCAYHWALDTERLAELLPMSRQKL